MKLLDCIDKTKLNENLSDLEKLKKIAEGVIELCNFAYSVEEDKDKIDLYCTIEMWAYYCIKLIEKIDKKEE